MNPLKQLEPEERVRYDFLLSVFEDEFELQYLDFLVDGILVYELLNILPLYANFFEDYCFPENEDNRMMRYAIIGTIAEYLEGGNANGL